MKDEIAIDVKTLNRIQDLKEKFELKGVKDPYELAVLLWLNEELHIV